MCRLLLYKGPEVALEDVLVKPEHNILRQSRDATYHPGCDSKRNFRLNGDGVGVAWYNPRQPRRAPCAIHFASPAWQNRNLLNICRFVDSNVIMGHVRAAFSGVEDDKIGSTFGVRVSEENTHPFVYGRYAFCHNGGVTDFPRMKRRLQATLSDEAFHMIQGNTDSEHCFAVFLDQLPSKTEQLSADTIADALRAAIRTLLRLAAEVTNGDVSPSSLNFAVTDGVHCVATRYRNGESEPPSLYYCYGTLREEDLAKREARVQQQEEAGDLATSPGQDFVEMVASAAQRVESTPEQLPVTGAIAIPSPRVQEGGQARGLLREALSAGTAEADHPEQAPPPRGCPKARRESYHNGELKEASIGDTLILSSEPLTRSESNWSLVPRNSMIIAEGCTARVAAPICAVRVRKVLDESEPLGECLARHLPPFAMSPIHTSLVGCTKMA